MSEWPFFSDIVLFALVTWAFNLTITYCINPRVLLRWTYNIKRFSNAIINRKNEGENTNLWVFYIYTTWYCRTPWPPNSQYHSRNERNSLLPLLRVHPRANWSIRSRNRRSIWRSRCGWRAKDRSSSWCSEFWGQRILDRVTLSNMCLCYIRKKSNQWIRVEAQNRLYHKKSCSTKYNT